MKLQDFVEITPSVSLKKGQTYPCIMMDEVNPGSRYVHGDEAKVYSGGGTRFQIGDVLFARITPCLENGKIAQYSGLSGRYAFGSTEFIIFRARDGVSDPGFVYYLAKTDIVRRPAEKSMFGASGRQRADINVIREITVPSPPLPTQRKIAAILSAYDDLIENNTRRIRILEEMAQTIYREWFVHFRFPGHEGVRLVDSGTELGDVPEGWEVVSLGKLFPKHDDIVKTGPFGSKLHAHDYREEGVPLILVKHVKNGRIIENDIPLVGAHKLPELGVYRLSEGDIIVTRVGYVGESAYIFEKFAKWLFSGQMLRVRLPNTGVLHPLFLASYYQTPRFKKLIENYAVGATRLSLNTTILTNMPLLLPPFEVQQEYTKLISPLNWLILNLGQKNDNLRATRDLLLPRLVSGELDVSELDVAGVITKPESTNL